MVKTINLILINFKIEVTISIIDMILSKSMACIMYLVHP
jgi:hypothetical protein